MTLETLLKTELWHSFEQQTRARRKQPADVLADLVRDYLETAEDVELNEAMRRDAHSALAVCNRTAISQTNAITARRHAAQKAQSVGRTRFHRLWVRASAMSSALVFCCCCGGA